MAEVVCGVQFRPLTLLQAPHYGLFWEQIRTEFPRCLTVAPLTTGEPTGRPNELMFQLPIGHALPRVWFISEDDSALVQLQPDRFLFNWREGAAKADYPRYAHVKSQFKRFYGDFKKFLRANKLGDPSLQSFELSYINHIPVGNGWQTLDDLAEVFPDLSWRRGERFVPTPEHINFQSNHSMPSGRLIITIASAHKVATNEPLIRFDLTCRGSATGLPERSCWKWFDEANNWIDTAFLELTTQKMQDDVWGRTE